ncbi:phytanoyl-CoA dioxygenase family protein [uncultured Aquimarina sp.]|uniref:phytanoyl-CoA dioxygenase family protein n=1 Tax=uncultured Aquimarina sp. TaxID=575652 RepID=UPI00260A33CD|nr:phytanoyl-CoA dioxygenase family protein [uncultured Aquimarina sp.]
MKLSQEQINHYNFYGYLIINELFTKLEINKLKKEVKNFNKLKSLPSVICENNGDIRSIFAPHKYSNYFHKLYLQKRLVEPAQSLIRDRVYLYQYKLNKKRAFTNDKWEWHQDFPYWYFDDGVKFPNMLSIMVLLQDTSIAQGPLIIIPGSHKKKIIEFQYKDHLHKDICKDKKVNLLNSLNGDLKYTIRKEKLKDLINKKGVVPCDGKIGTCIFFHPNLIHASNSNISPFDRDTAIITYNSINNSPTKTKNIRPDYLCSRYRTPIINTFLNLHKDFVL